MEGQTDPATDWERPAMTGISASLDLRLYVAGRAPNSILAETNLRQALARLRLVPEAVSLEVVDILRSPQRALADGILVTPALVRLRHDGTAMLIGNLGDGTALDGFLGA